MAETKLFEAALGIGTPWHVRDVTFDAKARTLTIAVDFISGSRFGHPEVAGEHPVHDTTVKRYRHLNFFQHECFLEVLGIVHIKMIMPIHRTAITAYAFL